tara:strand:- start:1888 stop:2382 length:495 start_codon:yes stop_codon:yes gene_type:complete
MNANIKNRIKKLALIIYDFDGVMTNNKLFVDQNGNEIVQVNRSDGLGVSQIKKLNINQIIISTEKNPVVAARAKKLGIKCFQAVSNKKKIIIEYCRRHSVPLDFVAFIGNDINDIDGMNIVGLKFCPSDAHCSIKKISDHIMHSKGGDGVIREMLDIINKYYGR